LKFVTVTNNVFHERHGVHINPKLRTLGTFSLVLFLSGTFTMADAEMVQPRKLVDAHTAGILARGQYDFEARIYPAGDTTLGSGLLLGINVGITNRLSIGLSYGGEGIVGRGHEVKPNPIPGLLVKYRIFEEGMIFPGVALGFDHQGHGGLTDTVRFRYKGTIFKSPGFFGAVSKNFLLVNVVQFGLHGMVSYSLEDHENVTWPNVITGIDIGINDELSMVFEYDFGFNIRDGNQKYYAQPGDGYLNAGLRWAFSPAFYLEFDARDVLEHRREITGRTLGWSREIKLVYFSEF